ncbi:MAG TPA: sigma-70 family RNA polymerase sigma factor [Acidimicrobiales bacterium]|nr:sigma-70 family RNA polymerase sigma factor [Acidimicrobiales bacterium]
MTAAPAKPPGPEAPMEPPDDEALADAVVALYPFALSLTRDPDRAADLVQDTWLRASRSIGQWRGDAPLASWLRRILHNLAVDAARRSGREVLAEEVEQRWRDDEYTVDAAVVAERAQTREELEDALARLPFIYRSVVMLHDIEGWTVAEIAGLLELGLPAAKQRLRRGRMMLVTALADGRERRENLKGVPMRCWDARQHVSEYLDGDLGAQTAALLERHLEACPTCPPLYASLVGVRAELGALRDPDTVVPPDLAERLAHHDGTLPGR